jgi:hypothetical protein
MAKRPVDRFKLIIVRGNGTVRVRTVCVHEVFFKAQSVG